jgi:hypothetical protein
MISARLSRPGSFIFTTLSMIICRTAWRGESAGSVFFITDIPQDPHRAGNADFEVIGSIRELETVSEAGVWQNFERLAAFIFEKHEFAVTVSTVKTLNRTRRQYDVIARKRDRTFLVECKKWAGSRYRLSALKRAILQHKERTAFYEILMQEDAVPVIVTLIEEEILVYEGVPIVPVLRLDAFIRELDNHPDRVSFSPDEEEIFFAEDLPEEEGEFFGEGES